MQRCTVGVNLFVVLLLLGSPVSAQQTVPNEKESQAIKKRAEVFVAAFNRGDARAVSRFWLPDGDYRGQRFQRVKGQKAIREVLQKFFEENKGAKIGKTITSIRVVNPSLIIEDGVNEITLPDDSLPIATEYNLVHVKHDGKWLIASAREVSYTPPSNYQHLRTLEWLVGEWVDEEEKGELASVSFSFTENQNFITSEMITSLKGVPVGGATQWIGWDPVGKHFRSWAFASNGGFAHGVWSQKGKKLLIKTKAVLPDGTRISATNVITRMGHDHITWQSIDRTVNGKAVADTKAVKMKRR